VLVIPLAILTWHYSDQRMPDLHKNKSGDADIGGRTGVGHDRFAEAICAELGIRHNSGMRGRPDTVREAVNLMPKTPGQKDFGF
jgi:hypothetical protein